MASEIRGLDSVKNGLRFVGEYLVPGGSNLVKGDYKQAGLHAALGLAARAAFGLPGLLLVSVNSLTKASTGRHLHEHLGLFEGTSPEDAAERATEREAPAPSMPTDV